MHYSCLTSASVFVFALSRQQLPRTKLDGTGVGAEWWGGEKVSLPHTTFSPSSHLWAAEGARGEEAPSWEGQVHAHLWLHILRIQFCSQCSALTFMPTTASWSKKRPEVNTRAESASCFADLLPSAWEEECTSLRTTLCLHSSWIFIKSPTTPHSWACRGVRVCRKSSHGAMLYPNKQTNISLSPPPALRIYNQKL